MEKNIDKLVEGFEYMNCCQTTLKAFENEFDFDMDTTLKMVAGFGSGMRTGNVCGAVTAINIVLGLSYASSDLYDDENKAEVKEVVGKFADRFAEVNGSCLCKELLGYDCTIEQDAEYMEETDMHKKVCPAFIRSAIELSEEFL